MSQVPIENVIADLIGDINDPGLMWQLGAIVLSVLLGWGLARLLRVRFGRRDAQHGVLRFGMESFGRVVGPLGIVAFLALSKLLLAKWHHVHLLNLALPIFGSLVVIRLTFYLLRRVFARQGHVGAAMLLFEKVFQLLVWLAFVIISPACGTISSPTWTAPSCLWVNTRCRSLPSCRRWCRSPSCW